MSISSSGRSLTIRLYDYESIPRNKELYQYLVDLTKKKIPGYGKSYADKYGEENTAQLLTMIFDYIRMTNLHDDTLFKDDKDAFQKDNEKGTYLTYTNPRDANDTGSGLKGHGQVSPIEINGTKGIGRFYSLSGVHIHVTCAAMPGSLQRALYPGALLWKIPRPMKTHMTLDFPQGDLFTNLPPLPNGVNSKDDVDKSQWPQWLKALETAGGGAEFEAAFKPSNWNWQLAFMESTYRDAVLSSPTANKFNRALVTPSNCENMRLKPQERLVQAAFLFDLFSPSIGWNAINPNMEIRIKKESKNDLYSKGWTERSNFSGSSGKGPTQEWRRRFRYVYLGDELVETRDRLGVGIYHSATRCRDREGGDLKVLSTIFEIACRT